MRHSNKFYILLVVFLILNQLIWADSSAFIGAFGNYQYSDDTSVVTHTKNVGIHGNFDFRTLIKENGFVRASLYGKVIYDPTAIMFNDLIAADFDGVWYGNNGELSISAGSEFSLGGYMGSLPYWKPVWEASYQIQRGYRAINPYFTYLGSAEGQQLFTELRIGFSHVPIIEFSYFAAAGIGFDSDFSTSETDTVANLLMTMNGLSGYLLNWTVQGSASYRWSSDANEEGFSGYVSAQCTVSPNNVFQIQISPLYYWEYNTSTHMWDRYLKATLRADVVVTEHVYSYLKTSVTIEGLADASPYPLGIEATAGIDIGF